MTFMSCFCDGAKILDFDRGTILKVSRRKKLEESFLSTLFLNFCIVLILFFAILILGGNISYMGKKFNIPVLFGLMLIYPFIFNIIVYLIYSLFGFVAEALDTKNHIKSLLSVGFHAAFVYAILVAFVGVFMLWNKTLGSFLFWLLLIYFLVVILVSISTIYNFSLPKTLMCLFIPFLILGVLFLALWMISPSKIYLFFV